MRVELRAAWMAEALAWDAPEATTTLLVKGTFDLVSGSMTRSKTLLPIEDDVTSPNGNLRYPSDRIPWKGAPEIIVVGHAQAAAPSTAIGVTVRLGDMFVKSCSARAGTPAHAVPLLESHLRRDAQSFEPVRLGPRLDIPPAWLQRRLRPGFDFGAFNAAPRDQWVPVLEPGMLLVLEGLTTGEPLFTTRLPREQPSAFMRASMTAQPVPVPLFCDTLWLDVDERIACLVWRALLPRPDANTTFVIVDADDEPTLSDASGPPTERRARRARMPAMTMDVADKLVRQGDELPFQRTSTLMQLAGPPPPSTPASRLPFHDPSASARAAPTQLSNGAPPLPPHVAAALAQLSGDNPDETVSLAEHTVSVTVSHREAALPFEPAKTGAPPAAPPPRPAKPPSSRRGAEETAVIDVAALGASLPFTKGTGSLPARIAAAIKRLEGDPDAGDTLSDLASEEPASSREALPFVPSGEESSGHDAAPSGGYAHVPHVPQPVPSAPSPIANEAPPAAPIARRPRVAIEVLAAIQSALLDGEKLPAALAAHDIDESTWRYSDRLLRIDLAREQAAGKHTLATQLELAIVEARRQRETSSPPRDDADIDTYVDVRAELDESDDPQRVLNELGITAERWARLRRAWTRRALTEPKIADEIRDKLTAKRRELRRLDG